MYFWIENIMKGFGKIVFIYLIRQKMNVNSLLKPDLQNFPSTLANVDLLDEQFVMMTIRSHDQYNTTIYGLDDRYRGIKGNRRVVLMNPDDMLELQLKTRDIVDISSHFNGSVRKSNHWIVIIQDSKKEHCDISLRPMNWCLWIQLQISQILLPQSGLFVPSVVKIP